MKALFASAMLLAVSVFAAPAAHAYLPVEVQTSWNPQQVTFSVENFYAAPIFCEGRFFAATASVPGGVWLDFAIGPVVAGAWGYRYMVPPYVYQGDYFISIPQVVAYCNYY
jgi:hypothetical protein